MRLKRFLLIEGGNAIKSSSPLNQANAQATLDKLIPDLLSNMRLSKSDILIMGSILKKPTPSGDIDVAISIPELLSKNNIDTVDEMFDFLESVGKRISHEVNKMKGLGVVSLAYPISNIDGQQSGKFVQVDLMPVESLEWASFSYHSPQSTETRWKAVYRNMLIIACVKYHEYKVRKTGVTKTGEEVPTEVERLIFDLRQGIFKAVQAAKKPGSKPVTIERIFLTNKPQEVVKMIFGDRVKISDLTTFEKVYDIITSSSFPNRERVGDIFRNAVQGIKKTKLPIPDELKEYS